MTTKNIILQTDSYKLVHWKMIEKDVEQVCSYAEARLGGEYETILFNGLQSIIQKFLTGVVVTQEGLEEAKNIAKFHLGSENSINIEGWQIIIDEFGGKLPLEIKAAPEGTMIPEGNVMFTIRNTDDRFPWLTNYVESILMKVYYPIVVGTRSKRTKDFIAKIFNETSDAWEGSVDFLFHDFSYRSGTTEDASEIAGASHLINSLGTDTVPALKFANQFYNADYSRLAFSVPASEHSIVLQYGEAREEEYLDMMLDTFPDGIVSIVMDTYSTTRFLTNYVAKRKEKIFNRWLNGKCPLNRMVLRPDSPRFKGDTPEDQVLWIHQELEKIFGSMKNSKGYSVLHPCCGYLYGDGISEQDIQNIYSTIKNNGHSVENCVVGQGSGLAMKGIDRDVIRMAIKPSAMKRGGVWTSVQKKPLDATKGSKAGRLKLIKAQTNPLDIKDGWRYKTVTEADPLFFDYKDELVTVFLNGEMIKTYTFDEVRANSRQ